MTVFVADRLAAEQDTIIADQIAPSTRGEQAAHYGWSEPAKAAAAWSRRDGDLFQWLGAPGR
jgi:hypothetical protein